VEDFFREHEERPTLQSVVVGGVELEKGSRVLLWPRAGGDIMDLALKGKVAFVEGIEQDYEDRIYIAVTLEEDPGRDLGKDRFLGHRFFFSPEEVEPLDFEVPHE
jgi:hydrogenase maturation protease